MGERFLFEGGLFMNKKFFTIGMAVLLGVSLSFLGCDDSTEETTEPTAAELAAAELAASADFKDNVSVSGATVTLTKDVTITEKATVADGVTLEVPTGKTLTIKEGATVTNNGEVVIKSGGVSKSHDNDNSAGATGFTVVETGGKAYFRDNLFFGPAATGGGTAPNFEIGSGSTFSFNNTSFVIDGNVTLNGIEDYDTGTFGDDVKAMTLVASLQTLTLNPGSTLTIASGVILNLSGSSQKQVIVKGSGSGAAPKVVLKANATLWHYNGINFYSNAGVAFTWGEGNKTHTATTEETYTWTDDANSTTAGNQSGWKAAAGS
jgi:hypothetical protein